MKSIRFVVVAVVLILIGQVVMAHPNHKPVAKQYNQHKRIQHGVHNGQLTVHEARALRMQQAKVRHYKQMAIADGRITHAEKRLINNTQRHNSRNIYHQKHDRQVRRY